MGIELTALTIFAVLFIVLDSSVNKRGEGEGARLRMVRRRRKEGSWGKDMQGLQGCDRSTPGTHLATEIEIQ